MLVYVHKKYIVSDTTDDSQLPLMTADLDSGWIVVSSTNFKNLIIYILAYTDGTEITTPILPHKKYVINDITDDTQIPAMILDLDAGYSIISAEATDECVVYTLGLTSTQFLTFASLVSSLLPGTGISLDVDTPNQTITITNTGGSGGIVYMRNEGTWIQYSNDNITWENVIAVADITGPQGDPGPQGPESNYFAGATTMPTYIDNLDGTITLNASEYSLYDNATFQGQPQKYLIDAAITTTTAGVLQLIDGIINYIIVNYNAGTPRYEVTQNVEIISESDILPHLTVYRNGTTLRMLSWDSMGSGLANKLHQRLVKTRRFERETGLILSETSTPIERTIIVSEGKCWNGVNRTNFLESNSSTEDIVQWYHTGGVWTNSMSSQYDNINYDNGTNLVEMTNNKWAVIWFYRCKADNYKTVSYVYSPGQFNSSAIAADQSVPTSLPTPISLSALLVGRIIFQKGASSGFVSSAFDTTYPDTQVLNHNDTANIQGGAADEYYHLNADEHGNVQNLVSDGIGDEFLANDGTYKAVPAGGVTHEQEETFPDPTLLNDGDEFWHNQTLTLYKVFDNAGTKIWVQSKDSGGAKLLTYLRLTDIVMATYTYYTGYAPSNSLETDEVWTITKIVSDEEGVVASKVKYYNRAWTDRGTL